MDLLRADLAGYAIHFFQAGGVAAQFTDVEQLGAANLVAGRAGREQEGDVLP